MQYSAWIALFRRIPTNLHDALSVGLATGAEVVIQQLITMDDDFLVVRGRMSGTTVEGSVMLVPYAQMSYVSFLRRISPEELQAFVGQPVPPELVKPESTPAPSPPEVPAPSTAGKSNPELAVVKPKLPDPKTDSPKPAPSKSILLARLRERLAEKSK